MTPTDWTPGLLVLAAGLAVAIVYLLVTRGRTLAPAEPQGKEGRGEDLDRRAQLLIEQLKELEAERHAMTSERYAAEKSRLELEAAAALRARDEAGTQAGRSAPVAPEERGPLARHPQLRGALWGAGVVLFFGVLGYLLVSEQKPRDDGESATGRAPPGSGRPTGQNGGVDAELAAAKERMKARPHDLDAASLVAHELIRRQGFQEASDVTERSLALDPFHVESRVHRLVLRAAQGEVEGAAIELERLVDLYPGAQEGLLFLGAIAMRSGDLSRALGYFERFSVEVPRDQLPPQLERAISQLRQQVGRSGQ